LKICAYPGSFDPVTNGHLDIIYRCAKLFDKVVVAVGNNTSKNYLFSLEERVELLKTVLKDNPKIEVDSFSGLLVDYLRNRGINFIIKGLRAVSDFEYEFQMASINKIQNPDIETLFMMADVNYTYLSSSAVKELARYGGNLDGFVPDCIKDKIYEKLGKKY